MSFWRDDDGLVVVDHRKFLMMIVVVAVFVVARQYKSLLDGSKRHTNGHIGRRLAISVPG